MVTSLVIKEMQIGIIMRHYYTPIQMAFKKMDHTKCWQLQRSTGTFIDFCKNELWEWIIEQPIWKAVWQFL